MADLATAPEAAAIAAFPSVALALCQGDVTALDSAAVLGAFSWDDDNLGTGGEGEAGHREIVSVWQARTPAPPPSEVALSTTPTIQHFLLRN